MDSVECKNPTSTSSSSASSPKNQSTGERSFAWRKPKVSAGRPIPIMGEDSWPSLPRSSDVQKRPASPAMSRSSSTSSLCSSNDQECSVLPSETSISSALATLDSFSDQHDKVDVELPPASMSMLSLSTSISVSDQCNKDGLEFHTVPLPPSELPVSTSVSDSDQDSEVAVEFHTVSSSTSVFYLDLNGGASDSNQDNEVTVELPATSSSSTSISVSDQCNQDGVEFHIVPPSELPVSTSVSNSDQDSKVAVEFQTVSSSTSGSDLYQNGRASDSNQNNEVTVEFPATSSSILPDPISAPDSASTSSLPFSDLDQKNTNVHVLQPPAQSSSPSPWTHNPNSNPQFRPNYSGKRFQNNGYTNRRRNQQSGFNNLNGNRGFVPNPSRFPPNCQHGLLNGPGSFLPPQPPLFNPALPAAPVPDFGGYYDSTLQDFYTAPYYAPYIMNGFPMPMYPYYPQDLTNGARMYPPPQPQHLPPRPPSPPVATYIPKDDVKLRNAILKQIEYYFSHENLLQDNYLKSKMDERGWVPIHLVAGFRRTKALTRDINLILEALQPSIIVEVQGDKIRRRGDWSRFLIRTRQISSSNWMRRDP